VSIEELNECGDCVEFGAYGVNVGPSGSTVHSTGHGAQFSKAVFSQIDSRDRIAFGKEAFHLTEFSSADQRAQSAVRAEGQILCVKTEKSAEAGVVYEWGGGKKGEFSGYIKGEAKDERGNYGRVEVERKSDGTNKATAAGGHKK